MLVSSARAEPHTPVDAMERVTAAGWKLYEWKTEHQFLGRYSVDKLQHFGRYHERSTLARCLVVVCLQALVPTFVVVAMLDTISLAPPALELRVNAAAIARSVVGHGLTGVALGLCMKQALATSSEGCSLFFYIATGLVITLSGEVVWVVIALLWRFPVPARELLSLLLSAIITAFYSRVVLKPRLAKARYHRVRSFLVIAATHSMHLWVFLGFALGFARAPTGVQIVLVVVQPALKMMLKRQVWALARKLNDLSTDVTLSLVEISAALCQALCVQNTRDIAVVVLLVLWELLLGLVEVHMYAVHDFVVDHQRTLQTATKIVEGSLPLAQVTEVPETTREAPEPSKPLVTATNAKPSVSSTLSASGPLPPSGPSTPTTSRLVLNELARSPSLSSLLAAGPTRKRDDESLRFRSEKVQRLRRTASDTINDHRQLLSESQDQLSALYSQKNGTTSREPSIPSSPTKPRARRNSYSWGRDPAKIYCLTDLRPTGSSISPQRDGRRRNSGSQPSQSSVDRPPLTDLQPPAGLEGSSSHRLSRRPSSVFLTPRTLLKRGSKRLLDLQRSSGRSARRGSENGAVVLGLAHQDTTRRPSQVNIDGMLVTRKDQARILEQTLQLLFSCEVLVVAEFVKVLVPVLHGLLLATLWSLPNAKYNVLLRDVTPDAILSHTLCCLGYAVAELPSLVYLCVAVLSKYGVSPLRLLAFILEQYWMTVQGKLIFCFVTLLFCVSVHQGMDFKVTP